jgi:hypothetical protein
VHVADAWPSSGTAAAPDLIEGVSRVLSAEGMLRRGVEASLLAQRVVDVMCHPSPRVTNAKTQEHYLGRGYPIETWVSPTGQSGPDLLRRCSREPELTWSGDDFRLDFFTIHDGVQDWIVTGSTTAVTGAKQDTMLPANLWPPRA